MTPATRARLQEVLEEMRDIDGYVVPANKVDDWAETIAACLAAEGEEDDPPQGHPSKCGEHEWVTHMIQMPQGYAKPGATRCSKCGAYPVASPASPEVEEPPLAARVARLEAIIDGLNAVATGSPLTTE